MPSDPVFDPKIEHESIRRRRAAWESRKPAEAGLPPEHPVGLAFSGGGIRSATFALGLAQALAEKRLFPQIDYLATVSGGGYTGSFLGGLFLPRQSDFTVPDPRPQEHLQAPDESARAAAERAERLLSDGPEAQTARVQSGTRSEPVSVFHPIRWLRENGRYLTPSGARDLLYMAAFYLRALLGIHYVLGLGLLGGVLAVYVMRLALHALGLGLGGAIAPRLDGLDWDVGVAGASLAWWSSPILWLAPLIGLLVGGPLVLAYWLVFRQEKAILSTEERAIKLGPWWLLFVAAVCGVLLGRFDSWGNPVVALLGFGAYLAVVVLLMQRFWIAKWLRPGEDWTFTSAVAGARLKLTQSLTSVLTLLLVFAACGLVDSLGQTLFVALVRGRPGELLAMGSSGGAIALLLALSRRFGAATAGGVSQWMKLLVRMQKLVALVAAMLALAALAALLVAFVQWVVWSPSFGAWRVRAEAVPRLGHAALLLGLIAVWLLLAALVRESLGFLNNSTFHRFYCARLVRTYLGAANFKRLHAFYQALRDPLAAADGARAVFVSESHPDDEIALRSYYGGTSAGPLHLICTTLNESLSNTSSLVREDRKGVALTVGPAGMNVDSHFYPWAPQATDIGSRLQFADLPEPVPNASGEDREAYDRLRSCERLPVGSWAAISGAAVSTGLGRMSSLGFSILTWLVNARLGYWWVPAEKMSTQRRDSALKTFDLVRQEVSGGFYGQRGLRWNLSDGGHFENTAVYELLRRRAALVVCSDNGADPEYRFNDAQNLVRRARIDFGAEIEFFDERELAALAAALETAQVDPARYFGTLEQFRDPAARGDRCALAARIRYGRAGDGSDRGLAREGLLILVKPSLTQFAPIDVKLYARSQPSFPQQSTGDQFFDEAQWESYRKLGQEIGRHLFPFWDGFVKVAKQMAAGAAPGAGAAG